MDADQLIDALQSPSAYPHATGDFELFQTHISWVILTGEYAYKIKKPMDFGFLDFSTLAKRKHFCEEEIRLNSRFAPEIYLDVVAITLDGQGQPRIVAQANDRDAIEYAVRMRQFDATQTLDKLAGAGVLSDADIESIGISLAEFHQRLRDHPGPASKLQPVPGSPASVWAPVKENFDQIRPLLVRSGELSKLDQLEKWAEGEYQRLESSLQQRLDDGYVRECHGDLHLGNMVKLPDEGGKIVFFDSIEFNENFRCIDVAKETAFTLMDLESRGMAGCANRLLNTYLDYGGDFGGLPLIGFYKAYYAMVRAKINLLQVASMTPEEIASHENYAEFCRYLELAISYTGHNKPFYAITCGVSGSGKSTAALSIAAETGAIVLRSDVERKRLFGLSPRQPSDRKIYTQEVSEQTFSRLANLSQIVLQAGLPCIVDATFIDARRRKQFADLAAQLGLPMNIILCHADLDTMQERLAQRAVGTSISEADADVMRAQLSNFDPLSDEERKHTVEIDTLNPPPVSSLIDQLLA